MPDFTARVTTPSGFTDFVDDEVPSRLNPVQGYPHRASIVPVATNGVQAAASVGGVEAPADGALGGRLFTWWWVQTPFPKPTIQHLAGKTSEVDLVSWPNGDANALGLWVLGVARPDGGAMLVPFVVE